jgi:hypothetical protein
MIKISGTRREGVVVKIIIFIKSNDGHFSKPHKDIVGKRQTTQLLLYIMSSFSTKKICLRHFIHFLLYERSSWKGTTIQLKEAESLLIKLVTNFICTSDKRS